MSGGKHPLPSGYAPMTLRDPFEVHVGPMFTKNIEGPENWYAFRVEARHLNFGGVVHGGMMMTFADAALGNLAWRESRAPCVTISMNCAFQAAVHEGDLIECHARLMRKTRAILFVNGDFYVNGRYVTAARSLWKVPGAV